MRHLTLRGPADVAAALPSLLGFHPTNSLVVIAFRGERIVLTMRVDLPSRVQTAWVDEVFARTKRGAPDAYVFVIADEEFEVVDGRGSALVRALIAASDVEVLDALMVGGGRWRSYLCDGACCPRDGTPILAEDVERIRCAMTLTGQVLAPDRAAIRAEFALADRALEGARFAAHAGLDREGVEATLVRLATETAVQFDDDEIGLAVALRDHRARDAALWIATSQADEWLHVLLSNLAALMRRTPDAWVDGVGVLAATAAWLLGDGARGVDACERAMNANPDCTLAQLLHDAMAAGLPPALWREGMRKITLEQCWLGELAGSDEARPRAAS